MKLHRFALAIAVLAIGTSQAAQLPPALHNLVASNQRQNTLFLCYTFDDDFRKYDFPTLRNFLAGFDCYKEWFRIVLIPYDSRQCEDCRDIAREIGAECKCLESSTRTTIALKYAPSASVFNADGDSMYAGVVLREVPSTLLRPTGVVEIHYEEVSEASQVVELIRRGCNSIVFSSQYDRHIPDVPVGTYELRAKGHRKQLITVRRDQPASVVIEQGKIAKPERTPGRYRSVGPTLVGMNVGVIVIPFRDAGHKFYKGVTLLGGVVRLVGVGALEGGVFFSSTPDTDFVREGFVAGVEVAPSFLCVGNEFSLHIKGGYLTVWPKNIGPGSIRGRFRYSAPYVGAGIFLGRVGRDPAQTKGRIGFSSSVIYTRPRGTPPVFPNSKPGTEIGGLSGVVIVQVEF